MCKHESCSPGFSSCTRCSPLLDVYRRVFFTRGVVNQLFVSDREKPFKSQDVKQFALNVGDAWKVKLPQYQGGEDFLNRVVRCTKGSLKKIPVVAKTDS